LGIVEPILASNANLSMIIDLNVSFKMPIGSGGFVIFK
jgi:hypothetical protein